MVQSNNKVADGLLESAHDSAVHDGLRLAVPRYLEAVDALATEDRREEALAVLAELLSAKEKRRGFIFGKREQSALGTERQAVAERYARIARQCPPTESSLDILNQLAIEFPDDFDVRLSNAHALRQAEFYLDSLDEFKRCKSLHPSDVDTDVTIGEVYCRLGRADEAAAYGRNALADYAKAHNDGAVANLAVRLLDFAPTAFEEAFGAFGSLDADALAKHLPELDRVIDAFSKSDQPDAARRATLTGMIAACYEKLLSRDNSNQALWQRLASIDQGAADQVRQRVDGKATARASAAQPAEQAQTAPAQQSSAPAQPAAAEPHRLAATPVAAAAAASAGAAATSPAATVPKKTAAGGLSAFTKRKALELFANSEYEAASAQLERVVRMSPDVEALEMLLECYLVLERFDDAARTGVLLADAEVAAGNRPAAIATLTSLSKKVANPTVEQRRVELMQNK